MTLATTTPLRMPRPAKGDCIVDPFGHARSRAADH